MKLIKNDPGYYEWLMSLIDTRSGGELRRYKYILMWLHNVEFFWTIRNDENRAAQGVELRALYDYEANNLPMVQLRETTDPESCSVLEMLIGLAKSLAENIGDGTNDDIPYYFWEMIKNLHFRFTEPNMNGEILDRFLSREYAYSGMGGIFPLQGPSGDQRKVELWYQAQSYFMEVSR